MSSNLNFKTIKYGEIIKCIIYGIIINILGGLTYWYYLVIKDIFKDNFMIYSENDMTDAVFNHYNTFVIG